MNSKVLIIDDEKDICYLISEILQDEKFITESALNSSEAIKKLETFRPDVIILDVWLGPKSELDGIELLKKIMTFNSLIPVIVITGHGTVDMAVSAIKNGAYDFIEKPFNSEKITILSKRAIESAKLANENKLLKKIANPNTPLIGNSSFIINLKKDLNGFSKSKSRILITGSRGSGKKLIAQILHNNSFGLENLAKIIDFNNLSDSELSEMLDENKDKTTNKNIFINSNNGTLIFDNIDSLPIFFQKKILFYLENEDFFNKSDIKRNIKIISISSINIDYEIQQGNFMKDLLDRLNVIRIKVPPINERREDVIPICNYYLDYFNKNKKYNFYLSKKSSNQLEVYDWPGNVHQIINYIEKTIISFQDLNSESDYMLDDLPNDMSEIEDNSSIATHFGLSLKVARQNFEKEYLLSQIKRFNGNIMKISEFTGMERTALYRKFKSLNISLNNK
jgi:two-component system nitrogen regulation response regulator NtrX